VIDVVAPPSSLNLGSAPKKTSNDGNQATRNTVITQQMRRIPVAIQDNNERQEYQSMSGRKVIDPFPKAYDELRLRARRILRGAQGPGPLQATALVHEAWIKLCTGSRDAWEDDVHFLRSAMRTMRCILIDEIRSKNRLKRGAGWKAVPLHSDLLADPRDTSRTMEVEEALNELANLSEDVANVVELRFFTGFDDDEIGSALEMAPARVRTAWRMARAWLRVRLGEDAA